MFDLVLSCCFFPFDSLAGSVGPWGIVVIIGLALVSLSSLAILMDVQVGESLFVLGIGITILTMGITATVLSALGAEPAPPATTEPEAEVDADVETIHLAPPKDAWAQAVLALSPDMKLGPDTQDWRWERRSWAWGIAGESEAGGGMTIWVDGWQRPWRFAVDQIGQDLELSHPRVDSKIRISCPGTCKVPEQSWVKEVTPAADPFYFTVLVEWD